MADNVPITAGSGTTIATDDIGGVHYQITKVAFGALNAATLVSAADPLPINGDVTIAGTVPVSGTFWQATQPVSGSVGISGSVAVTGTFWQATQPVSGTVTANLGTIAGVATETTLAALNTKTPSLGQTTMANSSSVVVASNQSAIPVSGTVTANAGTGTFAVSGTFWQATQPVSGTITANAGSGTFAISAASLPLPSGASTAAKQPALGTAGTAATDVLTVQGIASMTALKVDGSGVTQPVSIAALPALAAGSAIIGSLTANQSVNCNQVAGTATATNNGTASAGCQRVTIASDNTAFSVNATPPTLTKATQGATGYSTQDLKDAGRVNFGAATVIGGVTAVSTEALLSLVPVRDGTAAAGATSIAVTSGKRLRVQAIVAGVRSSAATVLSGRVALRMNPSGAVTATSPIIAILSMTQQAAALAEAGDTCTLILPDGFEISGTQQIGLTQVCSGTGGVVYASIVGFEY